MRQQQAIAEELFYAMKSLDVDIANMEQLVASSGNAQGQEQVRQLPGTPAPDGEQLRQFLSGLNLYDRKLTEQERLILRVTRRLRRMRAGGAAGVPDRGRPATSGSGRDRALRAGGEAGAGDGLHAGRSSQEFLRAEPAAAVLLPGDAGERFRRRSRSGPPTRYGHRQGHVAVHSRDRRSGTG